MERSGDGNGLNFEMKSQKGALLSGIPFIIGFVLFILSYSTLYISIFIAYFVIVERINQSVDNFSTNISNASKYRFLLQLSYFAWIGACSCWYFYLNFTTLWSHQSFWQVFYVALFVDFMIKHATMFIKGLFLLLLSFQSTSIIIKRGNVLHVFESISQLVRCLMQSLLWCSRYFIQSNDILTFTMLMVFILYLIIKGMTLYGKLTAMKQACSSLSYYHSFITSVTSEEDAVGQGYLFCPLCHFDFEHKSTLPCGHVFCKVCINTWFDKESYCPECMSLKTRETLLGQTTDLSITRYPNDDNEWKSGRTCQALIPF